MIYYIDLWLHIHCSTNIIIFLLELFNNPIKPLAEFSGKILPLQLLAFFFFLFFISASQKNIIVHIPTLAEKIIENTHSNEMLLFSDYNIGLQLSISRVFKIDRVLFLILYGIFSTIYLFNISINVHDVKIQTTDRNALLCWIPVKQNSFLMKNSISQNLFVFRSLKIIADMKEWKGNVKFRI